MDNPPRLLMRSYRDPGCVGTWTPDRPAFGSKGEAHMHIVRIVLDDANPSQGGARQ
jgi:hypothetical protein